MPDKDLPPLPHERSPSLISMHLVDPSPVEETPQPTPVDPEQQHQSKSNPYFPPTHTSSPSSPSSTAPSIPKALLTLQKYSTYPFLAFLGLHLTNTSLIPLFTRSLHTSDTYLLLTRPYYQSAPLEKALLLAPIALHTLSGVALRIYRRRQTAARHGASTHTERRRIPWPALSAQSQLGYALGPLVAGHVLVNRVVPLRVEGGSSGVGLRYVAHGFAKHPVVANVGYAVLVAVGVWHVVGGAAKWFRVSPEYVVEGGDYGARKKRKRRRVINATIVGVYLVWIAGGLGVVGRGDAGSGWEARNWEYLYASVPLVGRWLS